MKPNPLCPCPHRGRFSRFANPLGLLVSAALLAPFSPASADLLITEFMADNEATLADADGEFTDWIELHNPGLETVDLAGHYLTDDPDNLAGWELPALTLQPGGFLVVFASGKDRADPAGELHTNFRLGAAGDYLALVAPDGTTVLQDFGQAYPAQEADVAYGLKFESQTYLAEGATARYHVPSNDGLGTSWRQPGFTVNATWKTGPSPLGYGLTVPGFTTRVVRSAGVTVNSLSITDSLLDGSLPNSLDVSQVTPVVNFYDTGGDGHYGSNLPFPGISDDEDFVIHASGILTIPTSGTYTFGINSDDGARLRIGGVNVINDDSLHGPRDAFGQANLSAGMHEIDFVFFERGGGAEAELFAAAGAHGGFNGSFRLIGDTASGGLAVGTFLAGGGGGGAAGADLRGDMEGVNATVYTRHTFALPGPDEIGSLGLRIQYNDGFVAFLNGVEIARRNAPSILQGLTFNSSASGTRDLQQSLQFESFNLTSFSDIFQEGANVLALHGLNASAGDGNFRLLPVISGGGLADSPPGVLSVPTPGAVNDSPFSLGAVRAVTLSRGHGFFETAFSLSLATETEGATIRYTTDGNEPTASRGAVYTSPLTISRTTVLRARAFKANFDPSPTATRTFLFPADVLDQSPNEEPPPGWPQGPLNGQDLDYGMDPNVVGNLYTREELVEALQDIPTMSIVTDIDHLFHPTTGIYVRASSSGRSWERPASLELLNPDGSEGFQVDCGIRIRGGFSRSGGNPKHAFRVFFRGEYGPGRLNYPLFGAEGVDEFDKFDLRTSQNYSWAFQGNGNNALLRDVWSRDAQGEMGHPYTRSRYYHLYLNGHYWGIFMTQERAESAYAETYFGGDRSDYDVITKVVQGNDGLVDGNRDAFNRLYQAWQSGFTSDAAYFRVQGMNTDGTRNPAFERLLDVDNLIDYMILTYYTGDRDGPGSRFTGGAPNNVFAILNREDPDGFKVFEHDSEHSLGTGDTNMVEPRVRSNGSFNHFNHHQLHERLADQNATYRDRFANRVQELLFNGGLLSTEVSLARLDGRATQIDNAIKAHSARWGDSKREPPLNRNNWLSAVGNIRNFITGRDRVLVSQLQNVGWYPDVEGAFFSQGGGAVPEGFELRMSTDSSGTIYYTTDGSDPRLANGSVNPAARVFQSSTTNTTLVDDGSVWRYLDDGSDLGPSDQNPAGAWFGIGFIDASWASGAAELGYGDGGEETTVGFGPSGTNKFITTYFRHTFNVANNNDFDELTLELVRDDGAIVYLNGKEVARDNMPGGPVGATTTSSGVVGGADESTFNTFALDPADLVAGENVLAVEVHQTSGTSSDISFDLRLTGREVTVGQPLILTTSTTVKARVRDGVEWSPLSESFYSVGVTPPTREALALSEIHYNPDGPGPEFIELHNVGTLPVDLTGARFTSGIGFTFPLAELQPGERAVVVQDAAAFDARYRTPGSPYFRPGIWVIGEWEGSLANGGETVVLEDAAGNVVHNFTYDDSGAWPGRADGGGSSLELVDPAGDYSDPGNWDSSWEYHGSPGVAGSGILRDIAVNEVLTNTDAPFVDTLELVNATGGDIDLSGWYLSDSANNYRKYRFPGGTVLPGGHYLVLDETDFNSGAGLEDFAFDGSGGDDVWIVAADANGNLLRFVDRVSFGAAKNGPGGPESFGRWPDRSGDLYPLRNRTFGRANSPPRAGPVVVNRISYNPAGTDDQSREFIELLNTGAVTENLAGWRLRGDVDFDFTAFHSLDPGASLILVGFETTGINVGAFKNAFGVPAEVPVIGPWTDGGGNPDPQLDNGGATVRLLRADDPVTPPGGETFTPYLDEDEVRYDDDPPWPVEADGTGPYLERINPLAWGNTHENWRLSDSASRPGVPRPIPPAAMKALFFTPEQVADGTADDSADPNRNGLSNLLDIAFGNDPAVRRAARIPAGDVRAEGASTYLTLTYSFPSTLPLDLDYIVEVSGDTVQWRSTMGADTEMVSSVDNGDGTRTVTIRDRTPLQGQPVRFIRVRVVTP